MNELAKFIKLSRVGMEMSQAEFAKSLGIHPTLVCKWELGQRIPTLPELQKMYELFGLDFSPVLFPKKEDRVSQLENKVNLLESKLETLLKREVVSQ